MATKKDNIQSSLNMGIKKKPIKATEGKAKNIDKKVKAKQKEKEEDEKVETIKTSVDFRADLYTEMKINLIRRKMTMRQYLEKLVAADLKKT